MIQGTQVLARSIDVLRLVAQIQRMGATLATITRASGLSRSTAFRIIRFLTQERLLQYDEASGHYSIGPLAFELGLAAKTQTDLIDRWQPRVNEVSRMTGMTCYLMVRSDAEAVCIATAESFSILRAVPLIVGQRLPLGVGAGSLALLSSLDDDEVRSIVELNRPRLGLMGDGRLTPDILWERIELARERGYAISQNSVADGVIGVGRTIPDTGMLMRLAISVSAPASQMRTDQFESIARIISDVTRAGGQEADRSAVPTI